MPSHTQTSAISFFNLLDILLDPGSVVQRLNSNAPWLYPLLIIGLGGIALGLANLPIMTRIIEGSLPAGLPDEQVQQTMRNFLAYQKAGVMLTPLVVMLKWSFLAAILWMSCVILDLRVSFKHLFALLAQCSLLLFLQDLTIYTIIRLKGDEVQTAADLMPRLGLDLLITGLSKSAMAVISYFSVFNIWYIIILTLALSSLGQCSKRRAFLATIPIWVLPLCLTVGLAWLS